MIFNSNLIKFTKIFLFEYDISKKLLIIKYFGYDQVEALFYRCYCIVYHRKKIDKL